MLLRKCPQTNIFFISIDVHFCGGNIKGIDIFSSELLHWRKLLHIPLMLIYIHAKWFSVNTTVLIMTSIHPNAEYKACTVVNFGHIVLIMSGNGYKLNNQFAMLKTKWLFFSLLWLRVLDFIMAWHGMALLPNNIWSTTMTEVEYRWDLKLTKDSSSKVGYGYVCCECFGEKLTSLNSSPSGQNGHHFTDNIFRCIFVNEKFCILIKISVKFVLKGRNDNNPALVKIMAWCRIGEKPLSEPMLTRFTDTYVQN